MVQNLSAASSTAAGGGGRGAGENRIKSAAAALLKGGTLVSEPCPVCGGVQVRAAGKVSCINCGNESALGSQRPPADQKPAAGTAAGAAPEPAANVGSLESSAVLIEAKIAALASEIAGEQDTSVQKQKSDLIEAYLRILEKMRGLARRQ